MQGKLPYYMVYPMPFVYDDGRVEERDIEYMKSLYPDVAKRILPYVEEECDRMEYQNSMMYDEYPDKLQLRMMCRRVYDNVRKNEKILFGTGYEDLMMKEKKTDEKLEIDIEDGIEAISQQTKRLPHLVHSDWLRDIVEIMLYQELMRRRRESRRGRGMDRSWYFR